MIWGNGPVVGHEVLDFSPNWPDGTIEESWWIGKPWRRIEVTRTGVKGTREYDEWWVDVTLGSSRLGWHMHWSLVRSYNDYSDEPHQ